ncbi:MAG TPA: response regulator [Herpetosiphonaceae bacterium]
MSTAYTELHPELVLLVDDQPLNCQIMQRLVEQAGYRTMLAYNGREALELVELYLPEVVLLDVWMPDMDGFSVLRAIRAHPNLSYTPVIMVTAVEDSAARQQAYVDGADDFLLKPVDGSMLLARLRTALSLKQSLSRVELDRERFAFVAKISRDLYKLRSTGEMLEYMVDVCAKTLRATHANMLLVDQADEPVNVLTANRTTNLSAEDVRLVLHKGAAGIVVRTGASLRINDITADKHWLLIPSSAIQQGSAMLVPVLDQDEVLGVLSVYHDLINYFTDDDQTLLELVAGQIAGMIRQARLREDQEQLTAQLTRQTRQLELTNALAQALSANLDFEDLYQVINEQMRVLMGHMALAIFSIEDHAARVVHASRVPELPHVTDPQALVDEQTSLSLGWISARNRTLRYKLSAGSSFPLVRVLGEAGFVGGMGVPLHHQGQPLGVLMLAVMDREFTPEDESLLEMARPHLSVALANARTIADRTARQIEQAELVHLRNMAELSGQMAHHFNNLFAAILGNTQLAELEATSPEQQMLLATVVEQVRDGAAMIGRLRLLRGGDRMPPPFPLDLSDALPPMLDHLAVRIAGGGGIRLEVEPGLFVMVHEREMQTLLAELLNNAVESGSPTEQIVVRAAGQGRHVVVSVRDAGRGIRDDQMALIWRPFWTSHGPQRLGLGLPISSSLMWRAGGQVTLTPNEDGPGVTAAVRLPRAS